MTGLDDTAGVLRQRDPNTQVTTIELFFDVVYVLAVTQVTELLLHRLSAAGVLQAALLLLAIWWAWVDTAWVTNWFDPDRPRVRLILIAVMGASLILSGVLPEAYGEQGLWFAGAYVTMQVGRSVFAVSALGARRSLLRNFQRILAWRATSGVLWLAGGVAHGAARLALWAVAAAIDTSAAASGFYLPRLGRSSTADWDISGGHLAERARLFIIIALGESILVTGSTFGNLPRTPGAVGAFAAAFLGSVALWWIYFDRSAEAARTVIVRSADPGRLGRSAYTYFHIPMVAGIIVTAVGDELTLRHPTGRAGPAVIATVLGGPVLFLAGYAMFKTAVFGFRPRIHLTAIAVLVALVPLGLVLDPAALSGAATGVVAITAARSTQRARRNPVTPR